MQNQSLSGGSGFHIYERNLPHWRSNSAIYFVTWRICRNESPLEPNEKSLIAENLEHFNNFRYWLLAYVIMDDHVHVLVLLAPEKNLQKTVHGWKSYTASMLQRISEREGSVWQQEYYDRIVRDEQELGRTLEYIRTNPVKRWPELAEYQWCKLFLATPAIGSGIRDRP